MRPVTPLLELLIPSSNRLIQIFILTLAYTATGWLGLCVPFSGAKVTLFWLPTGIALAALYRWSIQVWPGIFLGAFIINSYTGAGLNTNLLIALGNTLGPLAALLLMQRVNCRITSMHRTNALCFLLIAVVSMFIPAAIGCLALIITTDLPNINQNILLAWWMGDSLGVLLAAPLLIGITRDSLTRLRRAKIETLLILSLSLAVALACFPLNNFGENLHLPIVYTSFLCVTWAALRLGLVGSATCTLGFSFIAVWSTAQGLGPFSMTEDNLSYYLIWLYSASLTLLGLMITIASTEIAHKSARLLELNQASEAQQKHMAAVIQTIPDLLFEIDRKGYCRSATGASPIETFSASAILGKHTSEFFSPKALTAWHKALAEADDWGVSQGKTIEYEYYPNAVWFELSIAKQLGEQRDDDRFICLARNITKRMFDHQVDLANEKRFRNIFESTTNIAVQGYNRHHEVIFWNQASEELYGFKASDAMGRKLEDLIIPDFMRAGVHEAIENWHLLDHPIPSGEIPLRDKNGNEVWVYSNHVLIATPNDKEMYCLDIDLGPQRRALQRVEQELAERKQVAYALRQSEQRLERAQLMARLAHWSWDIDSDDYIFSPSTTELFLLPNHLTRGQLKKFIASCVVLEDRKSLREALAECAAKRAPLSVEFRIKVAGNSFWLHAQGELNLEAGVTMLQGTLQDITERKRLDAALRTAAIDSAAAPDFFETLLKSLMDAIGADHAFIALNDTDETASTHTYIRKGEHKPNFQYEIEHTPCADIVRDGSCFIAENATSRYPKSPFLQQEEIESIWGVAIKNTEGLIIGSLIALAEAPRAISAQAQALMLIFAERISGELRRANDQEKIFNLAFFDPLTRLPNRRMMLDRLKLITAQSARSGHHAALLFIDLDHFKLLNDTRGHHIGDQLLMQVAERIRNFIRSTDLAVRLGGDEFVVVFDHLSQDAELAAIEAKTRAEQLHELIRLPYPLQQTVFHCTISIGVNLFNSNSASIDDLLRHADVAMYQAKDSGRNAIRFFDPHMQSRLELRATIESDLRKAYELNDQLIPYYQMQADSSGRAIGAELLLRWHHHTKGWIPPSDFIPVAEQTGLIVNIGKDVIRFACAQIERWSHKPDYAHLTIAVNVSPIQFNQTSFVDDVLNIVRDSGINPQRLKLELTESSLLKNVDQSIEKMQALQAQGIDFAMDDFGIGYSSLSYLKRLPLYQLKIDQSFVRDIAIDPNDAIIVCTIIAMAKNMNLNVLAEGVETKEQKDFLERNGCPAFQGYYFGRPVPITELEQQLAASFALPSA